MKNISATVRKNCIYRYGCTVEEAALLNEGFPLFARKSPMERYRQQVWMAEKRRIEWAFTFVTWKQIWDESGMWAKRGADAGCYVMARFGDIGPYSPENVAIVPVEQNMSEAQIDFTTGRPRLLGQGKGWVFKPKCTKRPYAVECKGKIVGYFATPDEATAAYQRFVANF